MEALACCNEEKGMEESTVLDTSLLIEGERGRTTVFSVIEFPPALPECTILWPRPEDYDRALAIALKLRKQGTPLGCTDILIASMCVVRHLTLLTKDKDFQAIHAVEPAFQCKIL